jgi:nitroreductase
MELKDVIEVRSSYRAFDHMEISDDMVREMAYSASRAPSCNNNQPWRFVFVREEKKLEELKETINRGNYWGKRASMIVAVFSKPELDCQIEQRDYNLLDTGMAMALLLLRAVDLGITTHPIAGFNQVRAKQVLNIPEEYQLLPLIIMGKRSDDLSLLVKDWQRDNEVKRSERKPLEEVMFMETFKERS